MNDNNYQFLTNNQSTKSNSDSTKIRTIALYGLTIFGTASIAILSFSLPFISPAFRRIVLPYLPATDTQINHITSYLKRQNNCHKLIDLGSGDGRIVIECAKLGINSFGVELNLWLVLYSKLRATFLGLNKLAHFKRQDLWKVDTSQYDNVVIFGVSQMMKPLETKILNDSNSSNKSIRVIACRFPLPTLIPTEIIGKGIDKVWVYHYKL